MPLVGDDASTGEATTAFAPPKPVEFQVADTTLKLETFCPELVNRALEICHQPSVLCQVVHEVVYEAESFILIINLRLGRTTTTNPCLRPGSAIRHDYQPTTEHSHVSSERIDPTPFHLLATPSWDVRL